MDGRPPLRRAIRVVSAALLLAWAAGPARGGDAPLAPPALLERLEKCACDVARRARKLEAGELLAVLRELRAPAAEVAATDDTVDRILAKAKPSPPPYPETARELAAVAEVLAASLPSLAGDDKTIVARQVLRLDGANAAAHELVGDVKKDGAWNPRAVLPALERRAKIQTAIQDARKLDVEVEVEDGWLSIFETLHKNKGFAVRYGEVCVQTATLSKEQVIRQVKTALRATALENWLLNGELAVPKFEPRTAFALVATKDDYKRAVAEATKAGDLTDEEAERARRVNGFFAPHYEMHFAIGETEIGSSLFYDLSSDVRIGSGDLARAQPALMAGLLSWIYSRFMGVPMLNIAWTERPKRGATSDKAVDDPSRRAMLQLAHAGSAGSRMWLKWLARRREDPAWAKAMVNEVGKIQGDELLKATFVADYLFETEEFTTLIADTRGEKAEVDTFVKSLNAPLSQFEERWRAWFFAGEAPEGLAQTLGPAGTDVLSAGEKSVLSYVDGLRRAALGKNAPALGFDRDLADGCRAHALYLARHPAQTRKWPDAHEEYPDQEGFTPAGGRAGLSSVIYPGVKNGIDAVDGWMATFYHRLPLIDPGLMKIGWGFESGVAVLNSGSLVAPIDSPTAVMWPASKATDVPRRFPGELPNPVPDADQSQWGYPVTIQLFGLDADPELKMTLHLGPATGGVVDCWYSTPQNPTNTQLAPGGAYCLIPKQALAANTAYTVVVDGLPAPFTGDQWMFTTGR